MLKTMISTFREKLLPPSLDLAAFAELARASGDESVFLASPELDRLIEANMSSLIDRNIRVASGKDATRALNLAGRILSGTSDASRAAAEEFRRQVRDLFLRPLYGYLRFMEDGERIYAMDTEVTRHLLRSSALGKDRPMPPLDAAFEMTLQGKDIVDFFTRRFVALKPGVPVDDLRDGADKSSISLFFTPGRDADGQGLCRISMRAYLPERRGGRTSHYIHLQVQTDGMEVISGAGRVSRNTLIDDLPHMDGPAGQKAMTDIVHLALSGCALLVSGELDIEAPQNIHRIMAARARNESLPKRQRERSRQEAPEWPDVPIRTAALSDRVEQLPEPRQAVSHAPEEDKDPEDPGVMQSRIRIIDRTGAEDLHARSHPQRMMDEFDGLGESVVLRSPYFVEQIMERVRKRTEADFGANWRPGSEGIRMDQMAIQVPPSMVEDVNGLMAVYQDAITLVPPGQRPQDMVMFNGLLDFHVFLKSYISANRQCFLLDDDLTDVLAKTDIDGILVDDVALPYRHFFLGFQRPASMQMDGREVKFEGAYIASRPGSFDLLLTFSPAAPVVNTVLDFVAPISISLKREPGLKLSDAILRAIEDGGYDLDRGEMPELDDEAHAYAEEMGIRLVPTPKSSQEILVDRREAAFGSVVNAIGVVANTLILLTAKPGQIGIDETWSGVSDRIRMDLTSDREKKISRGRAMAEAEGITPIRLIRLTDAAKARLEERRAEVRGSPSVVYDRRGHWKMQAYGPKHSFRRPVWVEPTTCNIKAGVRADGSVYVYRSSSAEEAPSP